MKIDKAIFGVDNSYFLEFWPIQSKLCKELLGVEPVLFFICDEESDFYYDGNGLVKKIKRVKDFKTGNNIHSGLLACIVRMYGTKYFPNEVCLTCDLDMLMINKEYFINQIESFTNNSLVIYSSDAYDLTRPETIELFKTEPFPFTQEMYNYPYNAAKGSTFDKILDTNCSFGEFVNRHNNYKEGYQYMWMIDEFYFSDCVNNKNHGIEVHKLKRGYTSPWIANRRIDRHNFPVELEWEGEKENQKKFGIYDEEKLKNGYYIDVNCCRPYSKYKEEIDRIVDLVLKHNNTDNKLTKDNFMKKIALISSYCDTQEKINILSENIKVLKSLGLDTLVISPITLPNEIIEISDFVFFTKENPLLVWPVRSFTFWKTIPYKDGFVKMHVNIPDYGWAALNQIKRLTQIALNYDYDVFYHIIYDLQIDDFIIDEIVSNEVNFTHPRAYPNNPNEIWESTLHFMSFNREVMTMVLDKIDLNTYLNSNGFAEGQVFKWTKELPVSIKKTPVKDKIYYWGNFDFFNYSKIDNYKLFLNKNDNSEIWRQNPPVMSILDSKLRLFFYDVKTPKNINIKYNTINYDFWLDNNSYIELDEDSINIFELIIDDIDYTDEYKKIMRNISYPENYD